MSRAQIARALLKHLSEEEPKTLNRLGVEIWDKTADVTMGTQVEEVLWKLCESGTVAFTQRAPIMFKLNASNDRIMRELEAIEAEEDPYLPDPKTLHIGG
jgi:redox-regulated HSP33 family molecular chaperone